MKVVYIAGPFRSNSAWGVEQNIRRAEETALRVWLSGAAAICPHANTRFYSGVADDELWLKGDIAILSRCDAVVLVPGWESSSGAMDERAFAERHNIPVFETVEGFTAWMKKSHSGTEQQEANTSPGIKS